MNKCLFLFKGFDPHSILPTLLCILGKGEKDSNGVGKINPPEHMGVYLIIWILDTFEDLCVSNRRMDFTCSTNLKNQREKGARSGA